MSASDKPRALKREPYPTPLPIPPGLTALAPELRLVGLARWGERLHLEVSASGTTWPLVLVPRAENQRWPFSCDAFGLGYASDLPVERVGEAVTACKRVGPVLVPHASVLLPLLRPGSTTSTGPTAALVNWCARFVSAPSEVGSPPVPSSDFDAISVHLLLATGRAHEAVTRFEAANRLRDDTSTFGGHTRAMMAGLEGLGGGEIEDVVTSAASATMHRVAARYWTQRGDPDRARSHWSQAGQMCAGTLALRAKVASARLQSGSRPSATRRRLVAELEREAEQAPFLHYELALLARERRDYTAAEMALRRALEADADHEDAWRELATLCLWRLDLPRVRECLKALRRLGATDARYHRVLGSAALLAGQVDRASAALERASLQDPSDVETRLWQAEATLARGRPVEALELAQAAVTYHSTLVGSLLRGLIRTSTRRAHTNSAGVKEGFEATVYGLLEVGLDQIRDPAEVAAAIRSREALHALLVDIFRSLGGNRSETLTTLTDSGTLKPLNEPAFGRTEAAAILRRAGREPADELLEALEANIARYPSYPQPWCYKGELELWLGRYEEARASFDRGLDVERTRWAYIGTGAVHLLEGRLHDAMASFAECERRCGRLRGATVTVYRGECHRRMGAWEAATRDLEEAVATKPTRIGAWINLSLTHLGAGRQADADETCARVLQDAPYLLRAAAKSLGTALWQDAGEAGNIGLAARFAPILEEALVIMRGNRASSVTTFFDPEGRFRAVQMASRWVAYAADHVFLVREALVDTSARGL